MENMRDLAHCTTSEELRVRRGAARAPAVPFLSQVQGEFDMKCIEIITLRSLGKDSKEMVDELLRQVLEQKGPGAGPPGIDNCLSTSQRGDRSEHSHAVGSGSAESGREPSGAMAFVCLRQRATNERPVITLVAPPSMAACAIPCQVGPYRPPPWKAALPKRASGRVDSLLLPRALVQGHRIRCPFRRSSCRHFLSRHPVPFVDSG
jgi:hypothetical protein